MTDFNDLTFAELPTPIQLTFTKRGMGVTALSDKSDVQARFDTFERLNRGAVELSAQEVRACIYDGPFNDLIRKLAGLSEFQDLVKLQKRDKDNATHEELVLKFFAYLNSRDLFSGAVRDFLNDYMETHRNDGTSNGGEELFRVVIESLATLIQGPFLRANTKVTPQNELEAVMVGAAEVLRDEGRLGRPPAGWLNDPDLIEASTGATNTKKKLFARIDRVKELLRP